MNDVIAVPDVGAAVMIDEARLLIELGRDVSGSLDLQQVLNRSLYALRRLFSFTGGSIQLIEDGALRLVAADPPATPEAYNFRLPVSEGFGGLVATTGEPLYSPDVSLDSRCSAEGRVRASSAGVRSYFGVPLIQGGRIIGLVQLDSTAIDGFKPSTRALAVAFVPTIAAAVQNALLYAREVRSLEELREAEQMKNDFLAIVSHELRTPLTALIGFSQTLAQYRSQLDDQAIGSIAERMLHRSRMLMRLIDDLLDVTAIERGELSVAVVPSNVELTLTAWSQVIEERHRLRLTVEQGLPLVEADSERLRQILDNLYDNARKFSDADSVISVRAFRSRDCVLIEITDTGEGIPSELQTRIFERFFQVESSSTRVHGGLGIGLYLVRRLCESMGATAKVQSALGAGTTIQIALRITHAGSGQLAKMV
ncbi:MAG: GAF domain-containing sensor histidine kinase [Actinomycetota bacterium]